jgi:hypothetical protein
MTTFLLHVLLRVLSGAQNGAGYARKWHLFALSSLAFVAVLVFAMGQISKIGKLAMLLPFVALAGKTRAFLQKKTLGASDIHFWENAVMLPVPIALFLGGLPLVYVAFSLPLGMLAHKIMVNVGSGLNWLDDRTDDPTGNTYGVSMPAWLVKIGIPAHISVPRTTQKMRLALAAVTTIGAVGLAISGVHFQLLNFQIL